MITVLHLINGLDTGGAERMLVKLVTRSNGPSFRHIVVSMTGAGTWGSTLQEHRVELHTLEMPRSRPSARGLLRLVALIARDNPDIVQTWLYHADLMGLVAGKLARADRVVWNIRCSNVDLRDYRRATRWIVAASARLSRFASAIVVNSIRGKEVHLSLGYSPPRWQLIPNGFDADQPPPDREQQAALRAELGLVPRQPTLGLFARFDPMKDHQTFLQAAIVIAQEIPTARFLLAGRGVEPSNGQLTAAIAEARLGPHVRLLGERRDIPLLLSIIDVACLSSRYGEGFPNILGEAMVCGVPCVATDVGDSRAIVADAGRIVAPGNPLGFAAACLEILRLTEVERERLSELARQRMKQHYSLDAVVAQYEGFYRALVAGRQPEPTPAEGGR